MEINKISIIKKYFATCFVKKTIWHGCDMIFLWSKKVLLLSVMVLALLLMTSINTKAQTVYYVRAGATGAQSGGDWVDAYSALPATLLRGATYYIADGNYSSYVFNTPQSGTTYITVKKATIADHGTEVGWNSTYGDGQAVFESPLRFQTSYITFDGNGTHFFPSNDSSDYGIKVSSDCSNCIYGIVRFGDGAGNFTNNTIRYAHIYNTTNGDINNGTVSLRFTGLQSYVKIQNCFIENSGKDGIQISGSENILVERCYNKRLGRKLPYGDPYPTIDYHGQAVQMFYGADDVIFRWNIWESCEGQSLISYGAKNTITQRLRFYGNIIFTGYDKNDTAGFNTSGGIIGNAWEAAEVSEVYIYNNTIVNQRDEYTTGKTYTHFPVNQFTVTVSSLYRYNDLYFNSKTSSASRFTGDGYHASGGGGTAGGINEQTNISSGIFKNYEGNEFSLVNGTNAGLDLTIQDWWDDGPDLFFHFKDSRKDILGVNRGKGGTWDRGAFEYFDPPADFKCGLSK